MPAASKLGSQHHCCLQMRSKKDFVHEEDVRVPRRLGWQNVVEGLELHKNVLSPAEQEIFIAAIRQWEEEGRRVSCHLPEIDVLSGARCVWLMIKGSRKSSLRPSGYGRRAAGSAISAPLESFCKFP